MIQKNYQQILEKNNIHLSSPQEEILAALEQLNNSIIAQNKGLLSSIMPKKNPQERGIYIYGSVGSGKSMLMDLFFDNLVIKEKQKVHFHTLMIEVHDYLHKLKQSGKANADPIKNIAGYLAKQFKLLCIDELQIDDIADAMVVGKLFRELISLQVIIVVTSNFAPDNLYPDGLQRSSFLPFIDLIKEKLKIIELVDTHDYRRNKVSSVETTYYIYQEEMDSQKFVLDSFRRLTNNSAAVNTLLALDGRELICPITAQDCAVFSFDQLCRAPMASSDYIAIAQEFNVIILTEIPRLSKEEHNEAKRFINLIDIIYEFKKILICSAKTDIESIYKAGKWHFEFARTVSRLHEMQSQEYLGIL